MSDPRTAHLLADIIADTNRMTPEQVAQIITDAEWHGTPHDAESHPVGHYVENHLNLATTRRHLVWVIHHDIIAMDLHTRKILATTRLETNSTLADLADLIDEGDEDFAHLVDTRALDRARLTDAERADAAEDAFADFTTDDDPDYFDAITALRGTIAA